MEEFQLALEKAKKSIRVADHMLVMTFPIVKDPKLLLSVLNNIFSAFESALDSLLFYERLFKRIPPFQDSFESKMNLFRSRLLERHKINKEYVDFFLDIKNILSEHKKSPVEFSRGDRFVICSSNYRMRTIAVNDIKKYIAKTKMFISNVEGLVSKDAGIFK